MGEEIFYYRNENVRLYKCMRCGKETGDITNLSRHIVRLGKPCEFIPTVLESFWKKESRFVDPDALRNRGGGIWQTKMRKAQMKVKKEEKMPPKVEDEEKGENKNEMTSGVVTRKRKREQKEEMSGTKRAKDEGQKQMNGAKRGKEKDQNQMDGAKRKEKGQEKMTKECNIEGTKNEEMDEKNGGNDWLEVRKSAGGRYNKIAWKRVELENEIISEKTEFISQLVKEKISKTVKVVDDEEEKLEIYESEEEEELNEDARLQGRNDLTLDCIDGLIQLGNGIQLDGGMEENVIKVDQIGQKNKVANELAKEGEDEEVENIVDNLFEENNRMEMDDLEKVGDERNRLLAVAEKEEKELAKKKSQIEEERKIKHWVVIDGKAFKINNFEEQKLFNYMEEERQKVLDEIKEERIKKDKLNEEKRQMDEQRERDEEAKWEKKNRPKRSCVEEQMQLAKSIEESKNEGKKELKRKEKKDEKKLKDEVTDLKRANKEAMTVTLMQAKWIEELESQRKKDDEEIRNLKIENEKMRKKLIEIEMEEKLKKWRKWLKKGKISIDDFEVVKFCIEEDVEENAMLKLILDERKKREERKRVDQISKIIPSAFMLPMFCPVASRTFCFPIELWF